MDLLHVYDKDGKHMLCNPKQADVMAAKGYFPKGKGPWETGDAPPDDPTTAGLEGTVPAQTDSDGDEGASSQPTPAEDPEGLDPVTGGQDAPGSS